MFWIGIIIGLVSWPLSRILLGSFLRPAVIERFSICNGKVLYIREEIKSVYPSIASRTVNDTGIKAPPTYCSLIEIPPGKYQETLKLVKEAIVEESSA